MRGIYTSLTNIRRMVFVEVAKMAYENNDYSRIEQLPYKIIPGEVGTYRDSVFLERAIVGERIRLAMGLSLRPANDPRPISEGIEDAIKPEKYYEPPLINIINFACHKCEDNVYTITDACQGCLAHPCKESCPKKCIYFENGKMHIRKDECIKCGKCKKVCPYNAIVNLQRPCAKACGLDAIHSDDYGRAKIDYDKCVSCGMCLVSCPFGAIADKSQIFQVIQAIKENDELYVALAPAFEGQFGIKADFGKMDAALKMLGFKGTYEVAIGADLCTVEEAQDFLEKVPNQQPFMGTSCCPSWSVMAKRDFPEYKSYISMSLTPMVLTARLIKKHHPNSRIVFVGPCAAKKLEASRREVRSHVDFVLTFEELASMFDAKGINVGKIEAESSEHEDASSDGRGFAVGGGVASAVANVIRRQYPDRDVKVESAQGLAQCKMMLKNAKTGVYSGYLLEGMACPGGCVAGAGTIQPVIKSSALVNKKKADSKHKSAIDSKYLEELKKLVEDDN